MVNVDKPANVDTVLPQAMLIMHALQLVSNALTLTVRDRLVSQNALTIYAVYQ